MMFDVEQFVLRPASKPEAPLVRQHGFTLLEILIVVAILSILMMVGTPLYQNYALRAKVSAELPLMDPLKKRVSEVFVLEDRWPLSNEDAGALQATGYNGQYLQSVEVTDDPVDGSLLLTYDTSALRALTGQNTIIFYPVLTSNRITWECDEGTVPSKYRPVRCR